MTGRAASPDTVYSQTALGFASNCADAGDRGRRDRNLQVDLDGGGGAGFDRSR